MANLYRVWERTKRGKVGEELAALQLGSNPKEMLEGGFGKVELVRAPLTASQWKQKEQQLRQTIKNTPIHYIMPREAPPEIDKYTYGFIGKDGEVYVIKTRAKAAGETAEECAAHELAHKVLKRPKDGPQDLGRNAIFWSEIEARVLTRKVMGRPSDHAFIKEIGLYFVDQIDKHSKVQIEDGLQAMSAIINSKGFHDEMPKQWRQDFIRTERRIREKFLGGTSRQGGEPMARKKLTVHRKGYTNKEGEHVAPATYVIEDRGKPGRTPESDQWYNPKVEMDWHKDSPIEERRQKALKAHKGSLLATARALQALANVTTDKETQQEAHKDATFFFQAHLYKQNSRQRYHHESMTPRHQRNQGRTPRVIHSDGRETRFPRRRRGRRL